MTYTSHSELAVLSSDPYLTRLTRFYYQTCAFWATKCVCRCDSTALHVPEVTQGDAIDLAVVATSLLPSLHVIPNGLSKCG